MRFGKFALIAPLFAAACGDVKLSPVPPAPDAGHCGAELQVCCFNTACNNGLTCEGMLCHVIDAGEPDSGSSDSGIIDAGPSDSGIVDSGPADAGNSDGGVEDGGASDAGNADAGPFDAGVDAGDPCMINNGGCSVDALCAFSSGSVVCECPSGFISNGQTGPELICASPCTVGNGGCAENASCSVDAGAAACACDPGFIPSTEVDGGLDCASPCVVDNGGCTGNAICQFSGGMVTCGCPDGYISNGQFGASLVCTSECAIGNGGCGRNASCSIAGGSVACQCDPGYASAGSSGTNLNCTLLDAGFDGGVDAGIDAGMAAGSDAGNDAGADAGNDAGFDAGMDAGPCGQVGEACCLGECVRNGELVCVSNECVVDYNWSHWTGVPPDVTPDSEYVISSDNLTVTDSATGLIWQRKSTGDGTWSGAISFCESLNLGQYNSGWRVPTLVELQTLFDFDPLQTQDADSQFAFPTVVGTAATAWASSIAFGGVVWQIGFGGGNTYTTGTDSVDDVLCVRSADVPGTVAAGPHAPPGRYELSNGGTTDGLVYDIVTQLNWQQTISSSSFTWSPSAAAGSAQLYCQNLNIGGFSSGWRVPSVKELGSIVDAETYDPTIDSIFLSNGSLTTSAFWTATSYGVAGAGDAVSISFVDGTTNSVGAASELAVRCVR